MYSILDILFTLNYYVIAPAILAFTVYTLPYTLKHNEPTLISIDGNIGSGKSTLIEFLKKKM